MSDDWVSPWWQGSCLPDRWSVCGISVPSLSVWHTFALEQLENRYIFGLDADRDDAASLLLVASRDRAGGRRLMLAPNHRARQLRKMYRRIKKIPWDDLHDACTEYVETCIRQADSWTPGETPGTAPRPYGSPLPFRIVSTLCQVYGYSREDAWNEQFALASLYHDAHSENAGRISLLTPQAQEIEDNWDTVEDAEVAMDTT